MKRALYWDIENVSAKYIFSRLSKKEFFYKKIVIHHKDNKPYSENDFRALKKRNFEISLIPHFKNSADIALISQIEKDIDIFDSFLIISEDHIFSEIIVKLLKLNKHVRLFTKKKNDELRLIKEIKEKLGKDHILLKKLERI